jgi:hypothetical protein
MNSQSCKGQLNDAWQARKRNVRTTDSFLETLAHPDTYDPPQPISAVKVDVVNPRERFHGFYFSNLFVILFSACGWLCLWSISAHCDPLLSGLVQCDLILLKFK